uniref:Regulator of G protein signaling 2 n=1 Tax=Echeneis naucrates TaxID=173247 RepID=A0A665SWW9_ECHNA
NWRSRIVFLLKTNSSKPMLHLIGNRPSADAVNQWAESLDKLLNGTTVFSIFLKSEFCKENIEFWTACEDFKMLTSRKARASKASNIYEEFIKSEAPQEINLDLHIRNDIIENLQEPATTSFLAAQVKIYSLMENNSYPRFIHSNLYKKLCAAARQEVKYNKS